VLAIGRLLNRIQSGEVEWLCSSIVEEEAGRNPDLVKRAIVFAAIAKATSITRAPAAAQRRAEELHGLGYGRFDAAHLAVAELLGVDVLLSTDDRFLRKAARALGNPAIPVLNPVSWLEEFFHGA
jgi:predicted nucleic acid-binding protein